MNCNLSVILAKEAPLAVILRRGPSKIVRLILWHTDTDELEFGQWFKGRIYEDNCDLSPDGSLFIYLAAKWNSFTVKDHEYGYAWTAISRPPWLTALALWPAVTWYQENNKEHSILSDGGGMFIDDKRVWLNHKPELAKPHPQHEPEGLQIIVKSNGYGDIQLHRGLRDGWVVLQKGKRQYRSLSGWKTESPWILERHNPKYPSWTLVEVIRNRAEFSVHNNITGETRLLHGFEWADWDQMGRLVFTQECALFATSQDADFKSPKCVGELSSQRFTPTEAPDWATHW